jgi:5-methylcytosine-specific restriction endonuclease McrA
MACYTESMKQCVACRTIQPIASFHKNRTRKDGLAHQCKACTAIRMQNRDKAKAVQYATAYIKANPEQRRMYNQVEFANRKAKRLGIPGRLTVEDWREAYGPCVTCGANVVTIDHIIPFFRNGPNVRSNIQPLCQSCNSRKSTK